MKDASLSGAGGGTAFARSGDSACQLSERMASEHWHLCSEMLFVFDGQGVQTLNGERFVFRSGDAFYIAPGTVHATVSEEERCYIGVTQFYCSGSLPSLYLSAGQTGSEAAALFSRLQEESTLRRAGYASMVQGLTFQALGRTDCHSGRSGCGFSGSLLAGGNHRAGQADAAAG